MMDRLVTVRVSIMERERRGLEVEDVKLCNVRFEIVTFSDDFMSIRL